MSRGREAAAMLEHLDAGVLPTQYGGALEPSATQVPGLPNEPQVSEHARAP